MLEKIHKWIDRIKYNLSKQSCYDSMERQGIAALGNCCGVVGGDRGTGYLAYKCCGCPYFVGLGGKENE